MKKTGIPETFDKLTSEFLTRVVQTRTPGVEVKDFEIVDVKRFGDTMVSTSDRLTLQLEYGPGAPEDLPRKVSVKLKRYIDNALGELYDNEVNFYVRLRPELDIEAPKALGGICDKESALFYLLLEDLTERNARFPNATTDVSLSEVQAVLDQFAKLHAGFWESSRLMTDLSWYQAHVAGSLHEQMKAGLPLTIGADMPRNPLKQELIDRLGTSLDELYTGYLALQEYQATLPQTILHGDGHIGNTYLLPDGSAGLLDFQLTARGAYAHDLNYLIVTALDVKARRRHERDLVGYYLEVLKREGIAKPPVFEDAWTEYQRGILWSFYVGWLTTPIANYGEAINRTNLIRIATAFEDNDTKKRIEEIL